MTNGIDVSEWQGKINWSKVKTDFAILRAGYGRLSSQIDKCFETNYAGCKSAGIPCGAYWFSYALTPDEARQEAQACIEVIKGKQFEYPIYYDVEENKTLNLGQSAVSAIIRAFLDELEKARYFAGLYMSVDNLITYTDERIKERYAVWIAEYDVLRPSYNGSYGMWQKSSTGRLDGIQGNVDLNEAYKDYPSIIKEKGLNGWSRESDKHRITVIIDGKTIIQDYEFEY